MKLKVFSIGSKLRPNLFLSDHVLETLGWVDGDELEVDIPTGGGLHIWKESDPTTHFGGVKEVIHEKV